MVSIDPKKIYKSNYYVYKDHVNKRRYKNIFNILNKIIMHIFSLFIDIEFVILSIEIKTFIL